MKKLYAITLSIMILLLVSSCDTRQELMYECNCSEYALLPIDADWSNIEGKPQNVTLLVYDPESHELVTEYTYQHNDNKYQSYVALPIGTYTVVVFNEQRNEIDYVRCRGHENLETLEFYLTENTKVYSPSKSSSENEDYVQEPGDLAVQIVEGLEVTPDVIDYTRNRSKGGTTRASATTKASSDALIGLKPINKTSTVYFSVHVKGLCYSLFPVLGDFKNIAQSVFVGSDLNGTEPASVQFNLGDPVYDEGSTTDGTITGETKILGVLGDRTTTADQPDELPILLDMFFMLLNKTVVNRTIDITKDIEIENSASGRITINIEILLGEPLPEVEGLGDSDSGFGSTLEDWDTVEIPLTNE